MNIGSLIARTAERAPDDIAIVDDVAGVQLCYRDFVDRTFRCGATLFAATGEALGARVAILADAGVDYLCAEYGAMSAGLVRVPIDPHLSLDETASQLHDADARLLLYDDTHAEIAERVRDHPAVPGLTLLPLAGLGAGTGPGYVRACAPDEIASLNYTGGSTGRPKAVVHTHGSLAAALQNIVPARPIGPGSVFLNVRPLWPIAAIAVLAHIVAGGTVVLAPFSVDGIWSLISRYGVNIISLVPTQLVRLLRAVPEPRPEFPTLQSIDIGAAAVPIEVLEAAVATFGETIAMLYGLTEAPWTCYRSPRETSRIARDRPETHGYVGRPLFGVELQIAGPDGPVATGEIGEVCIRGSHVMRGYWKQPDLTAEAIVDAWFHTGDLGRIEADGRLYLAGRVKSVIRSGGKSVQPAEVEDVLLAHPAVSEAAVIGLPDVEWGEIVVAAVVLAGAPTEGIVDDIMLYCRASLSSYKRPKEIRLVDELPRSHYGKVQAGKVRELFLAADAAR